MPTVRTTCPNCEIITVDAMIITVRRRIGEARSECTFVCPACVTEVVQPVADRMVPALIGAGCAVEEWPAAPGLTETEIEAFVQALERDDWLDELQH